MDRSSYEKTFGYHASSSRWSWLSDEITGLRDEGVDVLISLLEPSEVRELGLQDEASLCERQAIKFVSFPISDRGVPSSASEVTALCKTMIDHLNEGKAIAVHCRAGIGRSALITASILVYMNNDPDKVFEMIGRARGVRVPDTDQQRNWVLDFQKIMKESSTQ